MKALLIFFLSATCVIATNYLNETKKSDSAVINKAVINLIRTCEKSGIRNVFMSNTSIDLYSEIFTASENLSINIIPKNELHWTTPFVIIAAINVQDLEDNLKAIHLSLSWLNSYGKFIILMRNEGSLTHNCDNKARPFFPIDGSRWGSEGQPQMDRIPDIVNIIYLCINGNDNIILYTFNPYNNNAPNAWKLTNDIDIPHHYCFNNDGLCHFFQRHYTFDSTCDTVFFEKATTLEFAPINANLEQYPPMMLFNSDESIPIKVDAHSNSTIIKRLEVTPDQWEGHFTYFDGVLMGTIFKFLNATLKLIVYSDNVTYDEYTLERKDMMMDLRDKKWDISLNSYDIKLPDESIVAPMYPIAQRDINIILVNRGYVDVPSRIIELLNFEVIISVIAVSIFLLLVFGLTTGQGFTIGSLNTFRLILGLSVRPFPRNLSGRIFLTSFFPFFMIIATIFESNIVGILSTPLAATNVDSIDDLQSLQYVVYAGHGNSDYYKLFKNNIRGLKKSDGEHCTELILRYSQTACVDDADYLKIEVELYKRLKKLHVMKKPIGQITTGYIMRRYWPIAQRFNSLLARLRESGLVNFWLKQSYENYSANIGINDIYNNIEVNEKSQNLTLKTSTNFFLVLLFGLALATFVFFLEVIPFKKITSTSCFNKYRFR